MLNVNNIARQVETLARDHGKAAGSWVIDGNTRDETKRKILTWHEEGDPQFYDLIPAPLSGEWADDPTPDTLADELELSEEHRVSELDQICTDYEMAFSEAFTDEVVRSCLATLPDDS